MMEKKSTLAISMIKTFVPILVLILSFTSCKKEKTANSPIYKKDYKQAILDSRQELGAHLMSSFTPGASVSVSIDGEFVWSEGLGLANKELKAPVQRNTKFRIGNSSQLFTAYLIAKMQEEGQLDIDSSFYAYIPEFPKKQEDFTIQMLVRQTAGFAESSKRELIQQDDKIRTLKDYVKLHQNDSLVYKPDSYSLQSNYSLALLGILAEDISQKRFSELMHETIIDTLQLENTQLDNTMAIIENRSNTYDRDYIARLINAPEVNLSPMAPAIGFLSTADDLNLAAQQLLSPGFFSEETLKLFYEPYQLSSGQQLNTSFGWLVITDREGRKVIGQAGSTTGGASAIAVYPEHKLVITLCANVGTDFEELPVMQIAQHFLDIIDPKEQE
ncbi:serine hydrolase domain-containing protein [Sunxiuqinia sp. sy24]|uniref:serine hydrolase domain-containing protein n=1 Tax=Sunxiuqinia sp. sy24 TaxID=3461495 RepID=UPI0040459DE7